MKFTVGSILYINGVFGTAHVSAPVDPRANHVIVICSMKILNKHEFKALVRRCDTEISIHLFICRTPQKH